MLKKIVISMLCISVFILTASDTAMRLKKGQQAPSFLVGVYKLQNATYDRKNRVNITPLIGKKALVLSFFSRECTACDAEIKALAKIRTKYEKKGIAFYLVLVKATSDKDEDKLLKTINERGYDFPTFYYPYPKTVFGKYIKTKQGGISSFPLTYFINKAGKIVKIKHGFNKKEPEKGLQTLIKILNQL
ncbi:MAG TPA: TlpA disulfide reductase family protein [Spirochaetota bacterium]|nr:TlpA disulfide reductase family protein [Spirochaetota bacterium]